MIDRDTIFISHSTPQDNTFSIWIASRLEMLGYKVWVDKDGLLGGERFWPTIQKAIDSCVEVYNPHYVSIVKHYDLNDTGNARRFIDKYQGDIKYNIDNKMWMIWNGINWQFDVFGNIKNYAEILIGEMKMEAFKITDLEKQKVMLKNINRLYNSVKELDYHFNINLYIKKLKIIKLSHMLNY